MKRQLRNKEKEAVKVLEYVQGFIEGKQAQQMPVFTDELLDLWCHVETALALIEGQDWED
jgi:hypothetical protein